MGNTTIVFMVVNICAFWFLGLLSLKVWNVLIYVYLQIENIQEISTALDKWFSLEIKDLPFAYWISLISEVSEFITRAGSNAKD